MTAAQNRHLQPSRRKTTPTGTTPLDQNRERPIIGVTGDTQESDVTSAAGELGTSRRSLALTT